MSLSTIIHAGLTRPDRPVNALVLMGGGARTAYQVGVLKALASMLRLQPNQATAFPFQVLVGTSAGALNAAYLAGSASAGLQAFDQLASFWSRLRSKNRSTWRWPQGPSCPLPKQRCRPGPLRWR